MLFLISLRQWLQYSLACLMGQVADAMGYFQFAKRMFQFCCNGDYGSAHYYLAMLLIDPEAAFGELEKAKTHMKRALALGMDIDPDDINHVRFITAKRYAEACRVHAWIEEQVKCRK